MKSIFGALAVVAALFGTSAASAAVLYSQPYDGSGTLFASQNDTNPSGHGSFATAYDDFTLASSATINEIDFVGGYFNGSTSPISAFTLTIYADSAGAPGSAITAGHFLGNANETAIADPIYSYSLSFGGPLLAAGTYWISLVPDIGFPPQWGWATSAVGNGNAYQSFDGSSGALGGVNLAFDVLGTPNDVPEPLTLSIFGAGLAGAAAMRRRKKVSA